MADEAEIKEKKEADRKRKYLEMCKNIEKQFRSLPGMVPPGQMSGNPSGILTRDRETNPTSIWQIWAPRMVKVPEKKPVFAHYQIAETIKRFKTDHSVEDYKYKKVKSENGASTTSEVNDYITTSDPYVEVKHRVNMDDSCFPYPEFSSEEDAQRFYVQHMDALRSTVGWEEPKNYQTTIKDYYQSFRLVTCVCSGKASNNSSRKLPCPLFDISSIFPYEHFMPEGDGKIRTDADEEISDDEPEP